MEDRENNKISATEAANRLIESDENGKYKIGEFHGPEERGNITKLVEILNQIDLSKVDNKGFENLRKVLGIIGAYDKYGYLNQEEKNSTLSEFSEKCKRGDLTAAKIYVNKFLGNMNEFSMSQIDEKFTGRIQEWIQSSKNILKEKLKIILKQNDEIIEKEAREKYNPDNIFEERINKEIEKDIKNVSLIEYKESIFNKIIKFIKKIIKRKKSR